MLLVADLDLDYVCMFSGSNKCFLWNLVLTLIVLKGTNHFLSEKCCFCVKDFQGTIDYICAENDYFRVYFKIMFALWSLHVYLFIF